MEQGGDEPAGLGEPNPTDEVIYNTLKDVYRAIPDTSLVTVKVLRERVAEVLGLGQQGLDGRRALVKGLTESIVNDEAPPNFHDGSLAPVAPPVPVPMTFQRALTATSGLILRKLAKPRFVPYTVPNIGLLDLTTRDFGRNPVKGLVDIVLNHRADFGEDDVKMCVLDGEMESLPWIARPPPGAVPVNHFTQTAFIDTEGGLMNVVRFITFQSDGEDGKVKADTARSHTHGTPYLINFGSNTKRGKKVFGAGDLPVPAVITPILCMGGGRQTKTRGSVCQTLWQTVALRDRL